jgi:biopolymer transport protein ExbD
MNQDERAGVIGATGLRARFFPKSRVGRELIAMAPWLNIVLLVIFFLMVNSRVLLQPGVVVDLPRAPFREGSPFGMTAVVMTVGGSRTLPGREIVFFDDERFLVAQPEQMRGLRSAFSARARRHPESDLIIQADQRVRYGTVVEIMNMALEAGVARVNIAVRTP